MNPRQAVKGLPCHIKIPTLKKLKLSFVAIALLTAGTAFCQVTKITLGVDGFTCSLCAKGVEGQIKSLEFVESVVTDLKNTTFSLTVKKSVNIDFKSLREAVTDGGFTVRDIVLTGEGTVNRTSKGILRVDTGNTPVLELHGVMEDITGEEKAAFKGKLSADSKSINISELRKL